MENVRPGAPVHDIDPGATGDEVHAGPADDSVRTAAAVQRRVTGITRKQRIGTLPAYDPFDADQRIDAPQAVGDGIRRYRDGSHSDGTRCEVRNNARERWAVESRVGAIATVEHVVAGRDKKQIVTTKT